MSTQPWRGDERVRATAAIRQRCVLRELVPIPALRGLALRGHAGAVMYRQHECLDKA